MNLADIDQLDQATRRIFPNNWDNTATQKVGDKNFARVWQDEVAFAYPALEGDDTLFNLVIGIVLQ
jgi:hypothetical protein